MSELQAVTAPFGGLSFFTVTQYTHPTGYVCDFRQSPRPHYCLGFVLRGKGVFESEGQHTVVEAGEMIFVPVGSCYRSTWTGEAGAEYISFHYFFDQQPPFDTNRHLSVQRIVPEDKATTRQLFCAAFEKGTEEIACRLTALGCFYSVLGSLLPKLNYGAGKDRDPRMTKVAAYLDVHYAESLSIARLAALCHMSPSHFHTCFKEAFGMTPITYKQRICIRYAILALIQGEHTVEEISAALGFESSIYFRRVFKKVTGKNPTAYLKSDTER